MNQTIWELRLAAQRHASQEAAQQCGWTPPEPMTYSDQIDPMNKAINRQLYSELMAMLRLDQNARAVFSALDDEESRARASEVDTQNLVRLKKLVHIHGFPSTKAVGEQGVNAALMLVAHADRDSNFQKEALRAMEEKVARGDLPPTIPKVFESIRPKVADQKKSLSAESTDGGNKSESSPTSCYFKRYNELVNIFSATYFRQLLKPSVVESEQQASESRQE